MIIPNSQVTKLRPGKARLACPRSPTGSGSQDMNFKVAEKISHLCVMAAEFGELIFQIQAHWDIP